MAPLPSWNFKQNESNEIVIQRFTEKELQSGLMLQVKPGVMFHTDGSFNLSIPSQPIIKASGKIQENPRHNYEVIFVEFLFKEK